MNKAAYLQARQDRLDEQQQAAQGLSGLLSLFHTPRPPPANSPVQVLMACDDVDFNYYQTSNASNGNVTALALRRDILEPVCEYWNPSRGFMALLLFRLLF